MRPPCFRPYDNDRTRPRAVALAAAVLLVAGGCGSVSKTAGHTDVDDLVRARLGQTTRWNQGSPDDQQVDRWLDELLRGGLTRERAVAIALFANPALQQAYEQLGVSQADMVQAGLLRNPELGAHLEAPIGGGATADVQGSLVQDFLDLFVLPARKRIAREQFEADILSVANQALETAAEVSKEVVAFQAASRLAAFRLSVADAALAASTLATEQARAGNLNQLRAAGEEVAHGEAVLESMRAELELVRRRERLNQLLGLSGPRAAWTSAEELPAPPDADPPADRLEELAVGRRLDVDAARKSRALMADAVSLARSSRLFGRVEIGVDVHQYAGGPRVFGPSLVLELPIFDQRQALIARLEAQERQAVRRLEAVTLTARAEVRLASAELGAQRRMIDQYRQVLLPLRERIVGEAQLHYNGMLMGLYQLLQERRAQIETEAGYIGAVRDYWIARADLERAVGGHIPGDRKKP